MKYHFIPKRLARIKLCLTIPKIVEAVKQWEFSYSVAKDINWTVILESNSVIPDRNKVVHTLTALCLSTWDHNLEVTKSI